MEYSETAVLRVAVSFALLASPGKTDLGEKCCGQGRKSGAKVRCCVKAVCGTGREAGRIGK